MITDWFQAGFSAVSTAATVIIVIFTWKTIQTYRNQVNLAQEQIRTSQEQNFNDARPVLVPSTHHDSVRDSNAKPCLMIASSLSLFLDGLKNIGKGPAFHIHGVFFLPQNKAFPPTDKRGFWNLAALSPEEQTPRSIELSQGVHLTGKEEVVKGYSLYAPSTEEEGGIRVEARLTLTYRDVFNRNHASIYDYHSTRGWVSQGHFAGVFFDLWEIDEQTDEAKQARAAYIRAGQIAQR